MKGFKQIKRIFRKRSVLIVLYVLALLFVLGIYVVDVFIWKNPPTKALTKVLLVLLSLVAALFQLTVKHGKNASVGTAGHDDGGRDP